jgi:hypothetical protein
MLTREKLTDVQWRAVRNTPHHVVVAVAEAGGGPIGEMHERHAGLQAIVDAMNSTHPLLQEIAGAVQIMQAQDEIRNWWYTLPVADRTPRRLRQQALESMRHALDVIDAHGGPEDLLHYAEFVLSAATRTARAAREGGLLGIGGELISHDEREFIQELEVLANSHKK